MKHIHGTVHVFVTQQARSVPLSPPRLMITSDDVTNDLQYVVLGDVVQVEFSSNSVFDALMDLIGCYYAWDLCYPRHYQILHFFHGHVLGERIVTRKISRFSTLEKMLTDI